MLELEKMEPEGHSFDEVVTWINRAWPFAADIIDYGVGADSAGVITSTLGFRTQARELFQNSS